MGWDVAKGIAGAADAGAGLISDSIKRDRDLEQSRNLLTMQDQIEQMKQQRIADIVNKAPSTVTTTVDDESGGHTATRAMTPIERDRARGEALQNAGLIQQSQHFLDRAERSEDKDEDRKVRSAKQQSDDEKWRKTFEETARHHKQLEKAAAAQLGLKEAEKKEFGQAVDSYVGAKANLDQLKLMKAPQDQIDAMQRGVDSAALHLQQWKINVGDSSDLSKHMSLSASLSAIDKTLSDPMLKPEDKVRAEAARSSVLDTINAITSKGKDKGDAGPVAFTKDPKTGKLVPTGSATATAAKPAGVINSQQGPDGKNKLIGPPFTGFEANLIGTEYGTGKELPNVREKL